MGLSSAAGYATQGGYGENDFDWYFNASQQTAPPATDQTLEVPPVSVEPTNVAAKWSLAIVAILAILYLFASKE